MISLEQLKLESSNFVYSRLYQVLAYGWQTTTKTGVLRPRESFLTFRAAYISLELRQLESSNFVYV